MHSSQHACDKLVDTIALLDQRNKSRNSALVVRASSEMGENEFLEGVDLVLKGHEIRDGLVSLVKVSHVSGAQSRPAHPSLGSLIDLRLIYSSYSKRPR